jgi:hypothetical protein
MQHIEGYAGKTPDEIVDDDYSAAVIGVNGLA